MMMKIVHEVLLAMVFAFAALIAMAWFEVPTWYGFLAFIPLWAVMLAEWLALRREEKYLEWLQ